MELAWICTDNIIHQLLRELPGAPNNVPPKTPSSAGGHPHGAAFRPELAGKLATIEKDGTVCKFNYAYKSGRFTVLVSPKADQDDSCKVRVLALMQLQTEEARRLLRNGKPNMNLSKILKSQKKNICMDGTGDTSLVMFGEYAW